MILNLNMYNPFYGIQFSEQVEKRYCYEQPHQKFLVFETNQFLYQNLIRTMNSQRKMMEQIDNIRLQLNQLKEQNVIYLQIIHALEVEKKELNQDDRKKIYIFKKHIYCPIQSCGNKYSSKIALNSHIRTKHKKNPCANFVSKTTDSQVQ